MINMVDEQTKILDMNHDFCEIDSISRLTSATLEVMRAFHWLDI